MYMMLCIAQSPGSWMVYIWCCITRHKKPHSLLGYSLVIAKYQQVHLKKLDHRDYKTSEKRLDCE